MTLRKRFTVLASIIALGGVGAAVSIPTPAVAKPCGNGYTHAVVNGSHKCLRRGQYCAKGSDSTYHRYGFHCHSSGRLS